MHRFRLRFLIGVSLAAILLLLIIQWYLVDTTFKYQQERFEDSMTLAVSKILEPYNPTDVLLDSLFSITSNLAKAYKKREGYTGQAFINEVLESTRGLDIYGNYLAKELPKKGYDVDFQQATVITFLGLNENGRPLNTFLFDTILIDNKIAGDLEIFENSFPIHRFTQSREDFLIGITLLIKVEKERQIVLGNVWLILGLVAVSILAVVGIFLFTIRSLIQQKRLADLQTSFINNITHEFKTPLATIKLATKNLRNPIIQAKEDSIFQLLDLIERSNLRLQRLMDQVMETSLVSPKMQLNKEQVWLQKFIEDRVVDFKMKLEDSTIQITTRFQIEDTQVWIDPFHFTTLLYNLLDNAIKYSPQEPIIELKTLIKKKQFELEIKDHGMGIEQKKLLSIFKKFYRVPTGNVHNVKGLGLGLFYVKQIVEAHEGEIKVVSKLGKGTTFLIKLPF